MYSRNKLFMVMVGLVILLISVVSTAVSCGYAPLSIELDSPDDGAVTKTNLVKASGIVSKPGAVVKIDGKEATVSGDGSFYAYLDLAEGENTIEALTISDGEEAMAVVTITYSPAVAVYISGSGDIDQSDAKVIITVTGHVIPVEASVEVNGTPVKVSQGGNFSTPVQMYNGNNIVRASASFEGEEDSYSFVRIVEDGKVIVPPGQGLMYQSRFSYEESVEMEAGEEMHLGIVGDIRKDMPDPIILSCTLDVVDGEYSEKEISPEGMEVCIEPSSFTVHPNTTYHLDAIIKTTADTPPGEYYLYLQVRSDGRFIGGWIKLAIIA